jgi:hypothetical protein
MQWAKEKGQNVDIKGVIRGCKSRKDKQYNGQRKRDKM